MTDYNEGELRLVKVVQSHAMPMSHLSLERAEVFCRCGRNPA